MKLTRSDFLFKMVQEVQSCPYLYKSYVYSLSTSMRHNCGIQCDASDDEIYDAFKNAWNACM